jgi:hypothetical protein
MIGPQELGFMAKSKKRLGELLIEAGLANPQKIFGDHLGTNLIEFGVIDDDTLAAFLSRQYGVPRATKEELDQIPAEILQLVPARAAQRLGLLPLRKSGDRLVVAMMDPSDERIVERISKNLGLPVECRVATEIEIRYYLEFYYDIPREPRQILLMQSKNTRGKNPPLPDSARLLSSWLDRRGTSSDAIATYFDSVGSLDKIPIRIPVPDLTSFDLTPELTFVLHGIDGLSSFREILLSSIYPRILTLRAVIHLASLHLIRFEES